jgi:hypothetical protein
MRTLFKSLQEKGKRKFLKFFKKGFQDQKYYDWERGYKEEAHHLWQAQLNQEVFKALLDKGNYQEIAKRAVSIESKTNLLFSFEKMAIRDGIKTPEGAKLFSQGLYEYIYGSGTLKSRFEAFISMLAQLPRKQTRVLTWPVATVFGFIANPREHIFLKPRVTQTAAEAYGFDFHYSSKVVWDTYDELLKFAKQLRKDLRDWNPKDMIDVQSFIWVLGSDEYG